MVSRVLAGILDVGVLAVALGAGYLAVAGVAFAINPARFSFPVPSQTLIVVVAAALATAYPTISWTVTGRTAGDVALGLRVVARRGGCPNLLVAFLRALCCVVFPIGIALAVTPKRRSLADLLLRTSVVYDWIPG